MNVLVIGDDMLDMMVLLQPQGIQPSPETPGSLVYKGDQGVWLPGGAANAAVLVKLIGASVSREPEATGEGIAVTLLTCRSQDVAGAHLSQLLKALDIETYGPYTRRNTIRKVRAIMTPQGTVMARIDLDAPTHKPLSVQDVAAYMAVHSLRDADCVLVSDYDKGTVDAALARALREWVSEQGTDRQLVVDTKQCAIWPAVNNVGDAHRILFTPNLDEAWGMYYALLDHGFSPDPPSDVVALATLLGECYGGHVCITRGVEPPIVYECKVRGGHVFELAIPDPKTVRTPQIVGAGDCFSAACAVHAREPLVERLMRAEVEAQEYVSMSRQEWQNAKWEGLCDAEAKGCD